MQGAGKTVCMVLPQLIEALLTTTMTGMKEVIDGFEKEGLRKKVKVMVGGASTFPPAPPLRD
jgi:methanogenic corrinoid protein MtbC1